MTDQIAEVVDRIGILDERMKAAKAALAELAAERAALVETLEGMVAQRARHTIEGRKWRATVVRRTTVTFPTKSADLTRSERLKGELQGAGLWGLVSDLSYPRLKSLWFHPEQAPEAFRHVAAPYATESYAVTVRSSPLTSDGRVRNA